MNPPQIDIDWEYLLERVERLMDLAEAALEERLETVTFENRITSYNVCYTKLLRSASLSSVIQIWTRSRQS